MQIQDLNS